MSIDSKKAHSSASYLFIITTAVLAWSDTLIAQEKQPRTMIQNHQGISVEGNGQTPLSDRVARQFAPQFGVRNPSAQLRVKKTRNLDSGTNIRYQQLHQGLPVIAGELVANLNQQDRLTAMSGEITNINLKNTSPAILASQAETIAKQAAMKWYGLEFHQLTSTTPVLSVFDPSLLVRNGTASSQLVWELNITPTLILPINEYVLVDALNGSIVFHFNKVDTALSRETYTANNQIVFPGTLVCDETDPTCAAGDQDARDAHRFAEDSYDFFFTTHGRDGIDGAGMTTRSTVHVPVSLFGGGPNAAWVGQSPTEPSNLLLYTDGMAASDDVVGHEYTHGVTDNTSNLYYYSESGAINESLSDVWGEFIDQSNGAGTDDATTIWQIGEDLPIGVLRDMEDPTLFNDPDRMTSTLFLVTPSDNGGVHTNSGVNNKAVYLMVEGGTFNSQTITGIGLTKVAHIYYEAQTNILTSGSDYLDLYNAVNTACTNLVGTNGIVAGDCTQVQNALTAVEMNQEPVADYAPTAEVCGVGINVYDLFFDNFEANNLSNWSTSAILGTNSWNTGNANLGTNNGLFTLQGVGSNSGSDNDSTLQTTTAIRVPNSTTAFIHFEHAFYFESDGSRHFDGGIIEYSTDNGASWNDAGALINAGRAYTGSLDNALSPLPGRAAFISYSNGFNSTRLNLSSLSRQFVLFRFRNVADEGVASGNWTIDNFRIYLCADNAPPIPFAGTDQQVKPSDPVQLSGTATDLDSDPLTITWTQTSGAAVTLTGANTLTPTFTAPNDLSDLEFSMSVNDGTYTETDTVRISIGITFNGSGGNSGCTISNGGKFDPVWLFILLTLTMIHLRRRKILAR